MHVIARQIRTLNSLILLTEGLNKVYHFSPKVVAEIIIQTCNFKLKQTIVWNLKLKQTCENS